MNIKDYAPQTTENTAVPAVMISSTPVSMVNPMNSKVQDVAILKILRAVALKLTMNGVRRQKNANLSAHVKDVAISTAVMNSITLCTELMMNSTSLITQLSKSIIPIGMLTSMYGGTQHQARFQVQQFEILDWYNINKYIVNAISIYLIY